MELTGPLVGLPSAAGVHRVQGTGYMVQGTGYMVQGAWYSLGLWWGCRVLVPATASKQLTGSKLTKLTKLTVGSWRRRHKT